MPTEPKNTPKTKGKPIFVGKSALVRLINDNDPNAATIWLVDPANKTLRPFVSEDQFEKLFDNPQQAMKAVVTLSSNELSEGGVLEDYEVLDSNYGVNLDGSMKDVEFSPSQLQGRYGQPINEDGEKKAVSILDSILGTLGPKGQSDNINLNASEGMGTTSIPGGIPVSPEGVPNTLPPELMGMEQPIMAPQGPIGSAGRGGKGGYDGRGGLVNVYNTTKEDVNKEGESLATDAVIGIADLAGGSLLTESFVNWIKSTPQLVGFYVGALVYGSYEIQDIVADMARRQKIENGDKTLEGVAFIDPSLTKSQFMGKDKQVKSAALLETILPPSSTMSFGSNWDVMKTTNIYNMPKNFYEELVPIVDITNPQTLTDIENIKDLYSETIDAIATASTEGDRLKATQDLQLLNDNLKRDYGLILSKDVMTAWKQLGTIETDMATRGIQGSGIQNEAVDKSLAESRAQNQVLRNEKNDKELLAKKTYYRDQASDAEIAALSDADRILYGLKPSAELIQKYSMSNLRAENPTLSEKELQALHDSVLYTSRNGVEMIRSTAGQKLVKDVQDNYIKTLENKSAIYFQQKVDEAEAARLKAGYGTTDPNEQFNGLVNDGSVAPTGSTMDLTNKDSNINTGEVKPGVSGTPGMSDENFAKLQEIVKNGGVSGTTSTLSSKIPTGSFAFGSTGENVKVLQQYLKDLGYFPSTQEVTGNYGTITRDAVAAFQKANNIPATTIAGSNWGPLSNGVVSSGKIVSAIQNANVSAPGVTQPAPVVQPTVVTPPKPAATSTAPISSVPKATSTAPINTSSISNAISNIQTSLNGGVSTTTPKVATTTPAATSTTPAKPPVIQSIPTQPIKPAAPLAPAKPAYTGPSIVDYLASTGGDSSYAGRAKLAASKGISNYSGSATQNTQLLRMLRGS